MSYSIPILTITTLLALLYAHGAESESENPHLILNEQKTTLCFKCHIGEAQAKQNYPLFSKNGVVTLSAYKLDGVAMCTSCHDAEEGHDVNLTIDFPVPADMPLGENNDIICLTCHYTHGPLNSEKPQASFSFMDRVLNAGRLKKSYLLRRNNSDGELCLTCHNPNQGNQQ